MKTRLAGSCRFGLLDFWIFEPALYSDLHLHGTAAWNGGMERRHGTAQSADINNEARFEDIPATLRKAVT
jgi:hypothetical protein